MLQKSKVEKLIQGVSICRRAPRITNLLFADDSLIFCQARQRDLQVITEILKVYVGALGQCINLEKSSVYFSNNTLIEQKN